MLPVALGPHPVSTGLLSLSQRREIRKRPHSSPCFQPTTHTPLLPGLGRGARPCSVATPGQPPQAHMAKKPAQTGQPSNPRFFSSFSSHSLPRTSGSQHSLPGSPQSQGGCFTPTRMVSSEHQKVTSADEDTEKAEALGKVARKVKWCKCNGK